MFLSLFTFLSIGCPRRNVHILFELVEKLKIFLEYSVVAIVNDFSKILTSCRYAVNFGSSNKVWIQEFSAVYFKMLKNGYDKLKKVQ